MATTRTFDLGDVLSVTTGRLVSRTHMDGVVEILDFLTGANLMTHQVPDALDKVAPVLRSLHPELDLAGRYGESVFDGISGQDSVNAWLDARIAEGLPASYVLAPIGDLRRA